MAFFSFMVAMTATTRPPEPQGRLDGHFYVYEAVPIFDEHTGEDGVVYDQRLLRCIAANCNRRIDTTGDWCPLVIGHTAGPDEPYRNPKVIGFAGRFWVDRFKNKEGRIVWAIYCNCWVFPNCVNDFQANPRRSVEVWPEGGPEQRFFDPIACLGAETPRRDLGLIYRKPRRVAASSPRSYPATIRREGARLYYARPAGAVQRYTAAGPSATNVTLPAFTGPPKKRPEKYQEPQAMPQTIDSETVNQFVEAMRPMIQNMIDEALGNGAANVGDTLGAPPPAPPLGADPAGAPPGMPPGPGAMPPAPGMDGLGAPPMSPPGMAPPPPPAMPGTAPGGMDAPPPAIGGDPMAGGDPALDAPPPAAPPSDPGPGDGDQDDPAAKKDDGEFFRKKFRKYAKANDEAGAAAFMGTLDDEEKGELQKYMASAEDGEKQLYAKCGGTLDDADQMKPGEAMKYRKAANEWQAKYSKERTARVEAEKGRDGYKIRYEKAEADRRLAEQDAWKWERYSRLEALYNDGVALNVHEELANTASYGREQFARHEETIAQKYQRAPRHHIPVDDSRPPVGVVAGTEKEKQVQRVGDVVMRYRKDNPKAKIDFRKAMAHAEANPKASDEEIVKAAAIA